jgi:HK97 family phage prohead protease
MKVQQKMPQFEARPTSLFDGGTGLNLGLPELREDGAFPKIRGYAAVFNQLSQPLGWGIRERIKPGAFKETIANGADVRALFNHDPSQILGRNKAGTLRLEEDNIGLRYVIDPPNTTLGRDVIESIRRGDVTQSSFGFRSKDEEYKKENGEFVRELVAVDLFDVSPVTYPAYTGTSVSVRTLFPQMKEEDVRSVIEPFFRDIKRALEPPPHLLPEFEKKLRLRRLTLIGDTIHASQLAEREALQIQLVKFDKRSWSLERASGWLAEHGYKNDNAEDAFGAYRFQQLDAAEVRGELEVITDGLPRGVMIVACK